MLMLIKDARRMNEKKRFFKTIWIKQYTLATAKQDNALYVKVKGIFFAQSCEGCAAECIISLIEFLYFWKIFSNAE